MSVADDIVNGEVCDLCQFWFIARHDIPVTCSDCWKTLSDEEKKMRRKAWHPRADAEDEHEES